MLKHGTSRDYGYGAVFAAKNVMAGISDRSSVFFFDLRLCIRRVYSGYTTYGLVYLDPWSHNLSIAAFLNRSKHGPHA